ncbi:MAG: EAL domain-containing protein [Desulfarculales bacterium]|jgi:diguanylate cyclase (GGDEF)-like protein/PAS domain S-box-containing protein|nr:EAL domain-containing protein [Desulfarculales bacterium]
MSKKDYHRAARAEYIVLKALNRSIAVIEFAPDGTVVGANNRFLKVSGYSEEDLIGKNHSFLRPGEADGFPDARFWQKLAEGGQEAGVFAYQRRDGSAFWLAASYIPVFSAGRAVERITAFGIDISETQKSGEEMGAKWASLDRALIAADCLPSGEVVAGNQNFLNACGLSRFRERGKKPLLLLPGQDAQASAWDDVCRRITGGQPYFASAELRRGKSRHIWPEAAYAPFYNKDGQLSKITVFAVAMPRQTKDESKVGTMLPLLANITDNGVMIADRDNHPVYINSFFSRIMGYQPEEMTGKPFGSIFGPAEKRVLKKIRDHIKAGTTFRSEEMIYGRSGGRMWSAVVTSPITNGEGRDKYSISVFTNITDTKVRDRLQQKTLEALCDGLPSAKILNMICREAEFTSPEIIAAVTVLDEQGCISMLAGPSLPASCKQALKNLENEPPAAGSLQPENANSQTRRKDVWESCNTAFMLENSSSYLSRDIYYSDTGNKVGVLTFYYRHGHTPSAFHQRLADIIAGICGVVLTRENNRTTIRKLALYDKLTGLPSSELFLAQGEKMAAGFKGKRKMLAVIVLGIDRLKRINDTMGRSVGDKFLHTASLRIAEVIGSRGLAGRISGEKFAVMLGVTNFSQALNLASRLQDAISQPWENGAVTVSSSVSAGLSFYPDQGSVVEKVFANAQLALNQARKKGMGQLECFSEELNDMARQRLSLEYFLREAVEKKEFSLFYQPQVFLQKHGLHGAEALCRWNHPVLGNVSPDLFIPVAEESDLINSLGMWTLDEGMRQLSQWRKAGIMVPSVSINLSSLNFRDVALPERIRAMLREYKLSPQDLVLELTESILLDSNPNTMSTMYTVHEYGVRLSMDDFGTGYSSLSYLRHLPVTELKLDRSFVWDLDENETSRRLSQAIMAIGNSLDLTVVAEGIETELQNQLLRNQGYHVAQGYLQSRPLPPDEFVRWYDRFRRA